MISLETGHFLTLLCSSLPSTFSLLYFHIDLLRLGLLSLGEDDGEHPLLAARLYVIPVYGEGEREAPLEGAEKPLYAMVVLLPDVCFHSPPEFCL